MVERTTILGLRAFLRQRLFVRVTTRGVAIDSARDARRAFSEPAYTGAPTWLPTDPTAYQRDWFIESDFR